MQEPVPSSPPPTSFWSQLSTRQFSQVVSALRERQFRYFLFGSFLSNLGTWMQSIAESWLVLQITNSAFYLGLNGFATTLPISIFAFWGGVIADRFDRRRLLIGTQWILMGLALILAVLTQSHQIRIWQIIILSFCTGLTQSIAWPAYQTLLANIVDRSQLSNAIALNSTQFNLARTVGPLLGALALSLFGTAGCFYANAASFIAVIIALRHVQVRIVDRRQTPRHTSFLQAFREGFAYMAGERSMGWLLLTLAASSIFGVPLMTLLPIFARDILKIGASGLGVLVGAFGVGAVLGGFFVAFLGNFSHKGRFVINVTLLFVAGMLGFAASRNLLICVVCLFIAGFAMVGAASVINTIIQGSVPDHLRGRAMSVFVFSFGGCMPIGNLLAGTLADHYGAPKALFVQGVALGLYTLYVKTAHPEIQNLA